MYQIQILVIGLNNILPSVTQAALSSNTVWNYPAGDKFSPPGPPEVERNKRKSR